MAVVKNLMIRIGADYSAAQRGMQGASRELSRFKRDTEKTMSSISGRNGLGALRTNLKNVGTSVTASLSEIRGAKGIEGVISGLSALRPAVGLATASLRGLGAATGSVASFLGPIGIGLGVLTAALAVATAGIAKASQTAVKFEADLGRLNMQLKGSSREFMDWARAQGLAKSTSAEMGATYATLLSSFISNNRELTNQTEQLVKATRVVASATGRTIDDVTERMRSGLLGNTEAIEDLGVFVNVAMIESTNAFKKFANGKHWDQLDFRVQQQIRLAAILEQAYARYGDQLQNNVMTKQSLLTEQLKDIKLNLSQAFLPIWDAILPALSKMAGALADVTESIARFTYWLRGWDYDERTKGTEQQTDAVKDQSKAYNGLASSAKKARGELAAFDQLNLLGDPSGGGGGGGTSGGGSVGGTGPGGGGSGSGKNPWDGLKPIPPELTKKWRIEFDPPTPPDAGLGAVVTTVVSTINALINEINAKLAQMWQKVNAMSQMGIAGELVSWRNLASTLTGVIVPGMAASIADQWSKMWANLQAQAQAGYSMQTATWSQMWKTLLAQNQSGEAATVAGWKAMLNSLFSSLQSIQPSIINGWSSIAAAVRSPLAPLAELRTAWNNAMSETKSVFSAAQAAFTSGFAAIGKSIQSIKNPLDSAEAAWDGALNSMFDTASRTLGGILSLIASVSNAWNNLKSTLSGAASGVSNALDGLKSGFADAFSKETFDKVIGTIKGEASKTENQVALEILSMLAGGGVAAGAGKAAVSGNWLSKLLQSLKGAGISVPAFAGGALVHGPTLAMVGDNKGAMTDPEVIAPVSMLQKYIDGGSDNSDIVAALDRVEKAVRDLKYIQAVISRNSVGQAAADYINDETRRGRNPIRTI